MRRTWRYTTTCCEQFFRKKLRGPLKIVLDGKEQFFTLNHKAVASEGKPLGDVFTLKNITHFKELDLSKTNLLATISHELKTPISSIKMSAQTSGRCPRRRDE